MHETTLKIDPDKKAFKITDALAVFTIIYNLEGLGVTWFGYPDKTLAQLHSEAILADAASCTKVYIYMSYALLGLAWFSYQEGKECLEKAASNKYCNTSIGIST